MDSPSAISLIPPVVVMAVAIWLKRPILSLVVGAVAGLLMLFPTQPFELLNTFAEISTSVMQDETIGWLILVCGGFGSLIGLLIHTGGAVAFGRSASKLATGPKSSMFMTFVLGCIIFIDDYLNALSVGEAMKRVTDKYKISRQMLAYIVDSTAAPICVIIPISTWAIFFGSLLEDNKVAEVGNGVEVYMQAIPYMLYPWLAVLMVLLVTLKIMPAIGPMKKAELAAQNGTPMDMLPDVGVEASASHHHVQGQTVPAGDQYAVHSMEQEFEDSNKQGKLRNFIVPMLMLIGFTIYFDIDVLKGLLVTLVLTIAFYSYQRLMPLGEMMEVMMNGFKTMLPAICTVIAAFVFKDVCDKLLLPQYVIENLTPYMTAQMLPAIVFLAMAILSFATGSSWEFLQYLFLL